MEKQKTLVAKTKTKIWQITGLITGAIFLMAAIVAIWTFHLQYPDEIPKVIKTTRAFSCSTISMMCDDPCAGKFGQELMTCKLDEERKK